MNNTTMLNGHRYSPDIVELMNLVYLYNQFILGHNYICITQYIDGMAGEDV